MSRLRRFFRYLFFVHLFVLPAILLWADEMYIRGNYSGTKAIVIVVVSWVTPPVLEEVVCRSSEAVSDYLKGSTTLEEKE